MTHAFQRNQFDACRWLSIILSSQVFSGLLGIRPNCFAFLIHNQRTDVGEASRTAEIHEVTKRN